MDLGIWKRDYGIKDFLVCLLNKCNKVFGVEIYNAVNVRSYTKIYHLQLPDNYKK